ncbi:Lrp/AsnC family transcriptional regulator [Asanoa siamensis]|uniref:Transcriptional regulator n=1 Tax=Asanoa siamensis TaxID=926357 RepID=A0ABQ4CV96_9ACTN|nr:Lrp/AsnC family transcriptional regulator [Asanoa siamensis]GIF75183.1 transcriptional regulator [Asanoa siamensis]
MDQADAILLAELQRDAAQPYAALAAAAGLSTAATHERVRKLRERGVIRRTTIEVDPAAVGAPVLAFVLVRSERWVGDSRAELAEIEEIEEAHVIAGTASLLLKIRTAGTVELQDVLRRLHGVGSTETIVVLESFFARPVRITRP